MLQLQLVKFSAGGHVGSEKADEVTGWLQLQVDLVGHLIKQRRRSCSSVVADYFFSVFDNSFPDFPLVDCRGHSLGLAALRHRYDVLGHRDGNGHCMRHVAVAVVMLVAVLVAVLVTVLVDVVVTGVVVVTATCLTGTNMRVGCRLGTLLRSKDLLLLSL